MLAASEQQVNDATLQFFTAVSVEFIGVKIVFSLFFLFFFFCFFLFQEATAVNVKLTAAGYISNLYNLFLL